MDIGKWLGRGLLGFFGLLALSLLWGKVRAADVAASPKTQPFSALSLSAPAAEPGAMGESLGYISGKDDAKGARAYRGLARRGGGGGMGAFALDKAAAGPMPEAPAASPARRVLPQAMPRKIVRNASALFEVKDYEAARRQALSIAARHGAEASRDDGSEREGAKGGVLAFRIAPERLDSLLRDLEPLGRVLSRSMSMENMTEEYVDLTARVGALRKVESRLEKLLAVNTSNLQHVLEVEREMQRVGTEIESLLGRMKYIDALAAESTLTVTLAEPARVAQETHGVFGRVLDSMTRTLNTFVSTGITLLDLTGFLLAVGLWAAPLAWLLRWGFRRLP